MSESVASSSKDGMRKNNRNQIATPFHPLCLRLIEPYSQILKIDIIALNFGDSPRNDSCALVPNRGYGSEGYRFNS
jgi:hypothetical protein